MLRHLKYTKRYDSGRMARKRRWTRRVVSRDQVSRINSEEGDLVLLDPAIPRCRYALPEVAAYWALLERDDDEGAISIYF